MKINKIKEICKKSNILISFRNSENVSAINPKNIYGTPTGIYSYPASDFLDKITECNNVEEFINIFPYTGKFEPNYIYFYQFDNQLNILDNNSTFEDIKPYYKRLIEIFNNKNSYFDKIIDKVSKYINNEKEKEENSFYGLSTFDIFETYDIRKDDNKCEVNKLWTLTYHLTDDGEDPNRWGNLFRKIGIDLFIDHGVGYIHTNEPIQALLLNPKKIINKEIIEINDFSTYKNQIKSLLKSGEYIDNNLLQKVYIKDRNFVFNILLTKIKNNDFNYIKGYLDMLMTNKDNKIVKDIFDTYYNKLDDIDISRLDEELIKYFINEHGDDFIKRYIKLYSSKKEMYALNDKEDLKNKLMIGSLFNANRKKTMEFFNRNKEYNFEEEIRYFYDRPERAEKYKDMNSYIFHDIRKSSIFNMFKEEEPEEKNKIKDIEHKYELFKNTYEKATGVAWDFEKFKERSKKWEFYGDYNGYVAVRYQLSGFYKLVGSAGELKSIMRGFNDLIKKDIPIWGVMSLNISEILIKRYGFYMPNRTMTKVLFNLIKPKSFGNVTINIEKDGGFLFNYEDTGESKKYFVANKKYYTELLKHPFIENHQLIKKMLSFFIKRLK